MMRLRAFSIGCVLLIGLLLGLNRTLAEPPDILTSYKFVPSLSTLRQTGGIAGFDWKMPVCGTYDFATGLRYEPRIPADAMLTRYAEFKNVNAYGAHPTMDPGLSLDYVFNLSGLDGEPVYRDPAGLELYRFKGTAGFNEPFSQVELLAARWGRWMYLRGHTEGPCCDFFEYELRGIARQLPSADWNEDGIVGADDLDQWIGNYGGQLSGRDFLAWQQQFGEVAPTLAAFDGMMNEALAAMTAPLASVPEPAGLCLVVVGVACACCGRRFLL